MIKLSDLEIGWIAGIIEGEGYIGIANRSDRPITSKKLQIEVAMCDEDTIEKLHHLIPGYRRHNRYTITGKQVFAWRISSHGPIKDLLELIYPLMSKRRKIRIDEVLAYIYRSTT